MPDTVPINSPAAGSEPSPAAPIEPAGADASASSVQQPATSGSAPAPGTPATAAPQTLSADAAFDAFLAEATPAPDNREQPPAPAQPPPPEAPEAEQPPATPEPPAEPSDGPELEAALTPTPDDQARGMVPVKNLSRALKSRREAIDRAKEYEARLTRESQIVDRVINTFQAAGVDAPHLPAFLDNLAKAKTDPQAKAAILAHLGIQIPQPAPVAEPPKPVAPTVDLAQLKQLIEGYDVAGAISLLESSMPSAPQPAQQPPPAIPPAPQPAQPPQQVQPPPPAPPADQPDPGDVQLRTQATAMIATLRASFGPQEAVRLSKLIDEAAGARIAELQSYGVPVHTQAVAKVYLEAQGKVLQAEQQRRVAPVSRPSQPVRPASAAPPRKTTADEQFEAEFGRRH